MPSVKTTIIRSILLLGGSGFLGRYVFALLSKDKNFRVHAPTSREANICSGSSLSTLLEHTKPDVIINFAGISAVFGDEKAIYNVNAFGHLKLLKALNETGFNGRLIFASSANVYGNETISVISESSRLCPTNHYAASKVLAEYFCAIESGTFETVIVRPFNCIGVGQTPEFLIPKIARCFAQRDATLELGNLDVARDYVDVRDLARMVKLIVQNNAVPGILNLCNNETSSIKEILSLCREITGHSPKVSVNPAFVRKNDLLYQKGCNERLKKLGYQRKYSLVSTLSWVVKSLKSR